MAVDGGLGVLLLQLFQEAQQRGLLGGGAGVLGFALAVETADIADADGMGIMAFAVRSGLLDGAALVNAAVEINHEVVPDVHKVALKVPLADLLDGDMTTLGRGTAMHQNFRNGTHIS